MSACQFLSISKPPILSNGHRDSRHPIESTFAIVRERSRFLGLIFKFIQQAEKRWKGIHDLHRLRDLFTRVRFVDGISANETQSDLQQEVT